MYQHNQKKELRKIEFLFSRTYFSTDEKHYKIHRTLQNRSAQHLSQIFFNLPNSYLQINVIFL